MQAIARVNRVFRDKPAGLVVDYIGMAQNLKNALRPILESATESRQAWTRARPFGRHGGEVRDRQGHVPARQGRFRLSTGAGRAGDATGSPGHDGGAIEWVLTLQQEDAAKETIGRG